MIGGGRVALRKARRLVASGARVSVVSPEVLPEFEGLVIEVNRRPYETGDLAGAALVFAATDLREVNRAVVQEAREAGIPVNVADAPEDGDFAVPSVLQRGELQVAVSTGGASPTLARQVREALEERFTQKWAKLVEELGAARRSGQRAETELEGDVDKCLSQLRV